MTNEGTEVEEFDQERIDKVIWRNADVKPVKWIADQINKKPDYVLRRKRELMEGIDSLEVQQARYRLISELNGMSRDARARAESTSDEFYAGTINASTGAIKTMLQELARMEKADSGKIETLNQMRRQEILRLIDLAVRTTFKTLSEKHDIPQDEMMTLFQTSLFQAAQEVESE